MNTLKDYVTTHLQLIQIAGCVGSCNSFNDTSKKVCVPNKTEDLDKCFDMTPEINES